MYAVVLQSLLRVKEVGEVGVGGNPQEGRWVIELIKVTAPRDHDTSWICCAHDGNPTQHIEGLEEEVEYVRRGSNRTAVLVGDLVEGIQPRDKRFEYGFHVKTVTEQIQSSKKTFKPIKNKIWVAGRGNHESTIKGHGDLIRDVFCQDLGIRYGTVSFKIIVSDPKGNLMYKAFVTHPHSGVIRSSHPDPIMRDASEKVQLKRRLARERMGDCILNMAGHFHKAIVVNPYTDQSLYLVDDGEKIKQRYIAEAVPTDEYIDEDLRWYGSIPGWIKKYAIGMDTYVERAGYDPLPIGCIRTKVRDGKIVSMEKALIP